MGLYGTFHDNRFVDMAPWEEDNVPINAEREFTNDYLGT